MITKKELMMRLREVDNSLGRLTFKYEKRLEKLEKKKKGEKDETTKDRWYINENGGVLHYVPDDPEGEDLVYNKYQDEIGNCFETREEAEKVVEKLKAFKRLKDKGFRFDPVDKYEALCGNGFNIPITATMPPEAYTDAEVSKDLDICFGGGE